MRGVFVFFGGGVGYGIPTQDLDASDAYTEMLFQGRSLVRISREMGLLVGLARDAYKKPDLKRLPVVRLQCVRSQEGGPGMIKRGFKVRVVKIDTAGGMDWQAKRLEGKVFTVRFIDSAGMIHLQETGIALIPGVDEYEILK